MSELPDWFKPGDGWEGPVQLDSDSMVHVTLPTEYPRELLHRVVSDLAEIPFTSTPAWALENPEGNMRSETPHDVGEAHRTNRLRTLQAASPIGWPAREMYFGTSRVVSDYYLIWRELKFLHFLATVRSCAESALGQVLSLVDQQCGFSVSVTARNVYTPDDVSRLIANSKLAKSRSLR